MRRCEDCKYLIQNEFPLQNECGITRGKIMHPSTNRLPTPTWCPLEKHEYDAENTCDDKKYVCNTKSIAPLIDFLKEHYQYLEIKISGELVTIKVTTKGDEDDKST